MTPGDVSEVGDPSKPIAEQIAAMQWREDEVSKTREAVERRVHAVIESRCRNGQYSRLIVGVPYEHIPQIEQLIRFRLREANGV